MKRTEKKRKDIIDAAIDEFREQGFLGATTTSIAKKAQVSSRTLYNHFESKEALFEAISEIMLEQNRSMQPVAYDPARDFAEQLKDALWRYVQVITEETAIGLNRMVLSELIRDLDRSRKFFTESATHDYPMTRLIGEAMDAGVIRKADPAFATNQLLALVKNFFFWPEFFLGENPTPKDVLDDCIAMFLAHYKADI
ncbi:MULTISPECIES: TetR/AcrR family transcriptional regulator [unclassified Ruegeria]|uniref:TetR/AcrR family transcriptional regulator n=1 Tax=unclassified Ruegeria TaxID=2625375 RepID=UPI0014892BF1|nr:MULTISPECIES: TetR/AcrR family transcriptional regulator [unclassified Ruegeria]NOD88823.1 TetR family transcriptional regulator [Ruegeria sp. HKCCD4318]NOE14591.1 TetR family transcriptional regulator [Ruegeria sp. HKCCD4318-2]NOG09888.1 TetR/AcrR family transcriptional regulator [Ruegeria sp. HKCCD4315]